MRHAPVRRQCGDVSAANFRDLKSPRLLHLELERISKRSPFNPAQARRNADEKVVSPVESFLRLDGGIAFNGVNEIRPGVRGEVKIVSPH
jgi:hypothetical protein